MIYVKHKAVGEITFLVVSGRRRGHGLFRPQVKRRAQARPPKRRERFRFSFPPRPRPQSHRDDLLQAQGIPKKTRPEPRATRGTPLDNGIRPRAGRGLPERTSHRGLGNCASRLAIPSHETGLSKPGRARSSKVSFPPRPVPCRVRRRIADRRRWKPAAPWRDATHSPDCRASRRRR